MAIDLQQFHQTFFEESFEGLDIMESNLLDLDVGAADVDIINTIFRAAHSIKGGSGTFGFLEVTSFTHLLETLLDEMREGKRNVDQTAVDCLLQSVDCLRAMLSATRDGETIDSQIVEENKTRLRKILDNDANGQAPASADTARAIPPAAASNEQKNKGAAGWHISFRPHTHMLMTGNDPLNMLALLEELGELTVKVDTSHLPVFDELHPEDCYLGWQLTLKGDILEAEIREVFEWVEDECDLEISAISAPKETTAEPPQSHPETVSQTATDTQTTDEPGPQDDHRQEQDRRKGEERRQGQERRAAKPAGSEATSIRVGIDKVDDIINLVGELVITQSMLGQVGSEIEDGPSSDNHCIARLRERLVELERNTRELQESVMRIRMLPISFAFSRFPRMVRDLAQKMGKRIELEISGEQTELDKTIMEKIGDPLVHLIRNSIDHGIEPPEERLAAGKPETGTVYLDASHQGGNIVIEVRDDGRGLDREKILKKARQRGLVQDDELISDEKIYELIFEPGFSTADQLSDVSGRGVGMDVVRRNIRDLGGSVEIKSQLGQGTTMLIRLPLTLAILDGQLVSVGSQTYIVPLTSIIESLQIRPKQVKSIASKAQVYLLRNEYIPIIRLSDIFGVVTDNDGLDGGLMVVVEGGGQKAGLVVDDLLAQQQVVIKSLETNFKPVSGLSGATILGDGTVALILDTVGLIKHSKSVPRDLISFNLRGERTIDDREALASNTPEQAAFFGTINKEMAGERDTIH